MAQSGSPWQLEKVLAYSESVLNGNIYILEMNEKLIRIRLERFMEDDEIYYLTLQKGLIVKTESYTESEKK